MKQIIALQQYTDKFISLYQGEIRNIQDNLADKLIEEGIVAEHNDQATIDALKALYVAMGGAVTDTYDGICDGAPVSDYVLIPDMILAMAQVAGGLPAVDAADNGKVLKVVNGAWSVAGVVSAEGSGD